MTRNLIGTLTLVALTSGLMGCSSPSGPEQAVSDFYAHLNAGNYSEAMGLYDAETREMIEDPEVATPDGFAKWARSTTREGTVDRVDVLSEETTEESSRIEFELVFDDGTRQRHSVPLKLENGRWKLGLIG